MMKIIALVAGLSTAAAMNGLEAAREQRRQMNEMYGAVDETAPNATTVARPHLGEAATATAPAATTTVLGDIVTVMRGNMAVKYNAATGKLISRKPATVTKTPNATTVARPHLGEAATATAPAATTTVLGDIVTVMRGNMAVKYNAATGKLISRKPATVTKTRGSVVFTFSKATGKLIRKSSADPNKVYVTVSKMVGNTELVYDGKTGELISETVFDARTGKLEPASEQKPLRLRGGRAHIAPATELEPVSA